MRLVRASFPDDPALDVAIGHALLERAAAGAPGPTLRVYRPGPTVAFGRLDTLRPGFSRAVAAAREHGFTPVLRQPGGHAAAYGEGAFCLDHVRPETEAIPALQRRFEGAAELFAGALRAVGVDARIGEIPGEYCPGAWTVSARGRVKLVGTAQRVVRGGSLLGAVVLVRGGARVRAVLEAVNAALALDWDPATAGAADGDVPGLSIDAVERAVLDAYAERFGPLADTPLDDAVLARARDLADARRLT
jgi:octanoyl-[GcvH]:protein N-octanoyltransferase